jgi:pyruvate,orthophosphate dikinase
MAKVMGISYKDIHDRVEDLIEANPMLGLRGCRLGNLYPEITEMQARAIIEAALELKKEGVEAIPEIMVPLTGIVHEFKAEKEIIESTIKKVFSEQNDSVEYKIGTMIEIPRAALTAHRIAEEADFFSFGTNDLTQMTFGYSREDVAKFLPR